MSNKIETSKFQITKVLKYPLAFSIMRFMMESKEYFQEGSIYYDYFILFV
jgi:hypothetical protein